MLTEGAERAHARGVAGSHVINNMGGPRSRARTERVSECYFSRSPGAVETGCYVFGVHESVNDIEAFLLDLARLAGFRGWRDIDRHIVLPDEKMMVFPLTGEGYVSADDPVEWIRSALILSMSNSTCYLPGGPRIFTRARLNRSIRLMSIKIDEFYELE